MLSQCKIDLHRQSEYRNDSKGDVIVLGPTHCGGSSSVLVCRQNARLALIFRGPGTGPVGTPARDLVLCVTIRSYSQLATSPEPGHESQFRMP